MILHECNKLTGSTFIEIASDNCFDNALIRKVASGCKEPLSKSKIVKVTRALLSKEKYDPIKSLSEIPHPEELFYTKTFIRVKQKTSEKGKTVSNVTHIQRPRDGVWESIESTFNTSIKKEMTMEEIQRQFGFNKPA